MSSFTSSLSEDSSEGVNLDNLSEEDFSTVSVVDTSSWMGKLKAKMGTLTTGCVVLVIVLASAIVLTSIGLRTLGYGVVTLASVEEQYYNYTLETYPEYSTFLGIHTQNDRLSNFTLSALAEQNAKHEEILETLKQLEGSFTKAQNSDRINYLILKEELESSIKAYGFNDHLIPMSTMFGVHLDFPHLISSTPFKTAEDGKAYLARLKALSVYIQQTIDVMKSGIAQKMTLPKIITNRTADQVEGLIASLDAIFVEVIPKTSSIPSSLIQEITSEVHTNVKSSWELLLNFLRTEYMSASRDEIAVTSLPNGTEYYNFLVSQMTTTDLSFEEIHSLGLSEVKRIRKEMEAIAQKNNMDFETYKEHIKTDPSNTFSTAKELLVFIRDWCKRADGHLPSLFSKLPRCPYTVEEIPAYEAPSAPGAYYIGPPSDCSRPGTYYVNTEDLSARPKYLFGATSLHETVPGHHLQISLAAENENIPAFRQLTGFVAYVEGWGLYAESLGVDMGMYDEDVMLFGRYSDEIFRACRLVVDTGMHAKSWTKERAVQFLLDNTAMGLTDVEAEVHRYIAMPAQALGYKIGEQKFLELRSTIKAEMGQNFDIRTFHDVVLATGEVPLYILEEYVYQEFCDKYNATCDKVQQQ
eukprot:TRINITY_DN9722_c0_g1_i1.p1 TRINITY_DN9722_c0_g1~~TRINITY_DN9722_c0_g1_i1.p1  ORF type:complete len:639 (+),score=146.31 TRINITY_DN9722_c0_g1_i1:16-1932(+)